MLVHLASPRVGYAGNPDSQKKIKLCITKIILILGSQHQFPCLHFFKLDMSTVLSDSIGREDNLNSNNRAVDKLN